MYTCTHTVFGLGTWVVNIVVNTNLVEGEGHLERSHRVHVGSHDGDTTVTTLGVEKDVLPLQVNLRWEGRRRHSPAKAIVQWTTYLCSAADGTSFGTHEYVLEIQLDIRIDPRHVSFTLTLAPAKGGGVTMPASTCCFEERGSDGLFDDGSSSTCNQ